MGNLDLSDSGEIHARQSSFARLRRAEAERELANYEALVQNYIVDGEGGSESGIDKAGISTKAVIDAAREAGSRVDDLAEQQGQLYARVLAATKKLHE